VFSLKRELTVLIYSSHGNSEKKHERQVGVAEDIAKQLGAAETGENIMGVMIESHLVAGECSCLLELSARRTDLAGRSQASNPSPLLDPSASPTANPSRMLVLTLSISLHSPADLPFCSTATPASTGPRPSRSSTPSAPECKPGGSSSDLVRASTVSLMA
jgi:hypothetical protein